MISSGQSVEFGDFVVTVVVTSPPWYENCYVIRHTPTGAQTVVDPGSDAESIITTVDTETGHLQDILFTHGHPDHIGAARTLERTFGVGCRAHAAEEPVVSAVGEWAAALMSMSVDAPAACTYFDGDPTLELGGGTYRALHTPGHTPGGVCYLFDGFAITGDTLFNQGLGRTDFPGGNYAQLAGSITRLLDEVPPETMLFSGHGPEWTAREAKHWWKWMA